MSVYSEQKQWGQMEEQIKAIDLLVQSGSVEALKGAILNLCSDTNASQLISRPVLLHVAEKLTNEMNLCLRDDPSQHIDEEKLVGLLNFLITTLSNHAQRSQFDESDYICRESLFSYHCSCGEYKIAAIILAEVDLHSTIHKLEVEEKANLLVRCAESFLQEEDNTSAETILSRARTYMNEVEASLSSVRSRLSSKTQDTAHMSTSSLLQLRYRVTKAKVDDANRKFVEAARLYYELSNTSDISIPVHEKLELLGNAVTCAVLGKAGPQRSRILGVLYKDDRLTNLNHLPKFSSHASVLTKMYTERLLNNSELVIFEGSLAVHQKALTSDGRSIVEKAVIEHNMQAAGKIYDNITFAELASILHLDAQEAEAVAAKMISEKRLRASIDQTVGILSFEVGDFYSIDSSALISWDDRIREICKDVGELVDKIIVNHSTVSSDRSFF